MGGAGVCRLGCGWGNRGLSTIGKTGNKNNGDTKTFGEDGDPKSSSEYGTVTDGFSFGFTRGSAGECGG